MPRVRNITGEYLRCEFVPGGFDIAPGQIVDVPSTQADGSPLIWGDYWQVVEDTIVEVD